MAIKKTTKRVMPSTSVTASSRMPSAPRSISAGSSITSSARSRQARPMGISASSVQLTPEQKIFASQLVNNTRRMAVTHSDLPWPRSSCL